MTKKHFREARLYL